MRGGGVWGRVASPGNLEKRDLEGLGGGARDLGGPGIGGHGRQGVGGRVWQQESGGKGCCQGLTHGKC